MTPAATGTGPTATARGGATPRATRATVGIVGAYGAVGATVAAALAPDHRLRLGGRDPSRLAAAGVSVHRVDVDDPGQLAGFVRGCDLVVNCAGPSCRIGATVADAALAAGAAYIDVGGDESLRGALDGAALLSELPVVLTAGLSPGLTGLLPRWLAGLLPEPPRRLRAWCGGLERFTPAAAADMVSSLDDGYGESMVSRRGGAVVRHALPALTDAVLAPFPGRVSALPYLSTEIQRAAEHLGLADVEWYNVFAGAQTLATLSRLRTATAGADPGHAAQLLVAAAELDLAGLRPYQLLVVELSGAAHHRTVTLRADDGYRLTAAVTVAAVDAVLRGAVPAGAHQADEVLDPAEVVAAAGADPGVGVLHVASEPATALVEEGVL